jgi:hypothetical protein
MHNFIKEFGEHLLFVWQTDWGTVLKGVPVGPFQRKDSLQVRTTSLTHFRCPRDLVDTENVVSSYFPPSLGSPA